MRLILREAALRDTHVEQLLVLALDAAVRMEDQVELEILRVVAVGGAPERLLQVEVPAAKFAFRPVPEHPDGVCVARALQHQHAVALPRLPSRPRMRLGAGRERERRAGRDVRCEELAGVAHDDDRNLEPGPAFVANLAAKHDVTRRPHGLDLTRVGLGSCEMDVSVVVTLLNEERSVEELHRRIAGALDGADWEAIFVDDGSTDATFEKLRAVHARDPHVRVVRFKRNFGQHPAMHAGLTRARGDRIVTMDGDLQNEPEDILKLLTALERVDVASGRRVARRDSPGRTAPSRVINGLLRRFTGVDISDFGCAFNAYRRDAIEPMLGAIGRQKFTKALVLSSGVTVEEVDVSHAASASGSRYSPIRLVRLALHVVA